MSVRSVKSDSSSMEEVFAFGGVDFSKAFDQSASGELAGLYRRAKDAVVYEGNDCDLIAHYVSAFKKDRLAQKIVQVPVFDGLSNWRAFENEAAAAFDDAFDLALTFREALEKARLFGFSVILPLLQYVESGHNVATTVPLEKLLSRRGEREFAVVGFVVLHDNIRLSCEVELDFRKDYFGEPSLIQCGEFSIHPSRCAIVGNPSVRFFDSICGYLADFHESFTRLQTAVRRNNTHIFKTDFGEIQKYVAAREKAGLSHGHGASELEVISEIRARALYQNLNDCNIAVIDDGEDVKNFQANNIADLVKYTEQQMYVLAGVADIPVSRLFSIQRGGLQGGGLESVENYAQALDGMRACVVEPALRKIDRLASRVMGFEFSRRDWSWRDTKAEEMLLRLRGQAVG